MYVFAKQKRKTGRWLKLLFSIVIFIGMIVIFTKGMQTLESGNEDKNLTFIQDSVRRSVIHCYAVEGIYPPDLEYLENNYGFRYDEEKYTVFYTAVGGNIMPEIDVIKAD